MPLPALLLERLKKRNIVIEIETEQLEPFPIVQDPSEIPIPPIPDENEGKQESSNKDDTQDEIMFADYSSDSQDSDNSTEDEVTGIGPDDERQVQDSDISPRFMEDHEEFIDSVLGCPNKYNVYHNCNNYCKEKFDDKLDDEPTIEQRKQLAFILRTYPMSNEWTAVYDPGVKTFYFWNIMSNHVSWYPPGMNGFISPSADQLRRTMRELDHPLDKI